MRRRSASQGRGRRVTGDRGAVLIEAAFVVPLLLTFILGLVDFGYIELKFDAVTSAARDGARVAITNPDITTAGAQTTCTPSPPDARFTAVCKAVARRLAGAPVNSVQVVCYVGIGASAALPTGVTDPNTQATCTSNQIRAGSSTVVVTVSSTVSSLTFVGQLAFGSKNVITTSRMVVDG